MEYENQDMQYDNLSFPVRVITVKSGMQLIQWEENNTFHRTWMKDNQVFKDQTGTYVADPHVGIPYGFDFTELVELKTTPEILDRELKRRGVWTLAELRSNPAALTGALQAAYGVTRATILENAEKYEKEMRNPLAEEVEES